MRKKLSLEKKVALRLERTGLISDVEFHLETDDEPSYMSFLHVMTTSRKTCSHFTTYLLQELRKTKPEIKKFDYSMGEKRGSVNAYLVINPTAEIHDKQDFITETLNAINTATKEYLHQNHIDDPSRG